MARILSHVDVLRRGSVAGITYLSNQYHQIVARARTAPVQPQTPAQQLVRGFLSTAAAIWGFLPQATRDAWDDYAATCVYHGPLGPYSVTGRLQFIANYSSVLNNRRLVVPFAIIYKNDAPIIPGFAELGGILVGPGLAPGVGIITLTFSNPNPDSLFVYAIRSIAWPATRARYKGPWVSQLVMGKILATGEAGFVTFTGLNSGMFYFFVCRGITASLMPGIPHRITAPRIIRSVAYTVV